MAWHKESRRHSLASRGVKTASNPTHRAMTKDTPIFQGDEVIGTVEDKSKLWEELMNFSGTGQYYKGYMGVQETDGVKFLDAKAGWLVTDAESILKAHPKVMREEFVSLKVTAKDQKATVTYEDGNGNKLHTQKYGYAELPDGEQKLFYTNGVLMLAGEY